MSDDVNIQNQEVDHSGLRRLLQTLVLNPELIVLFIAKKEVHTHGRQISRMLYRATD